KPGPRVVLSIAMTARRPVVRSWQVMTCSEAKKSRATLLPVVLLLMDAVHHSAPGTGQPGPRSLLWLIDPWRAPGLPATGTPQVVEVCVGGVRSSRSTRRRILPTGERGSASTKVTVVTFLTEPTCSR